MNKDMKDLLVREYGKVWNDQRMVEYCVKKASTVVELPDGSITVVEKQPIETRFCYGESGYDYDNAQRMAAHARTSEDYFREQNMKRFQGYINDILESYSMNWTYKLVIYEDVAFYGQSPDCRFRNIGFVHYSDLVDDAGYIMITPGKSITVHGRPCHVATAEEHRLILEAYQAARDEHRKKVDAYLKRYGLSKVHSWTYWRDA